MTPSAHLTFIPSFEYLATSVKKLRIDSCQTIALKFTNLVLSLRSDSSSGCYATQLVRQSNVNRGNEAHNWKPAYDACAPATFAVPDVSGQVRTARHNGIGLLRSERRKL